MNFPGILLAVVAASICGNEAVILRSAAIQSTLDHSVGSLDGSGSKTDKAFVSSFDSLITGVRELSKEEVMQSMSLEKAYDMFTKMNHSKKTMELVRVVKAKFQHLSNDSSHQHGSVVPAGYSAVDSARDMLNEMMEEAMSKKDVEEIHCNEFENKQLTILRELEQDIAYTNSEAAGAREGLLHAQEIIQVVEEVKLPTNRREIKEHGERCTGDVAAMKAQLSIVTADADVMRDILKMVCAEDVREPQKEAFLEATSIAGAGTVVKCVSCMTGRQLAWLRQNKLQPLLSELKSDTARMSLQESLLGAFDESAREKPNGIRSVTLTQEEINREVRNIPGIELDLNTSFTPPQSEHCNEKLAGENSSGYRGCQDKTHGGHTCQNWNVQYPHEHWETSESFPDGGIGDNNYCRNPTGKNTIWCYTTDPAVPWEYCAPLQELKEPNGVSKHECVETNQCKLSGPDCGKLRDRFLVILAGMLDQKSKLSSDIYKLENSCEEIRIRYSETISSLESQLKEEQTTLAGATKSMTENQQQSDLSNGQHSEQEKEYHEEMTQCCANKNAFTAEICALEKIRGELYRLEGIQVHIQDCEVSEWTDEECSVSCGGGKQDRTRSIIVHAANGTACPPLQMERSCNLQGCPVDCKLDEWSEWSSCTAECNGGVMTRVRSKTVEPENNGLDCEEQSQSRECNTQACNKDCDLNEWSEWGLCSKACDGGKQLRSKAVKEPERGTGVCAHPESDHRLEFKDCNTFDCSTVISPAANRSVLQCPSMIDLVVLLDGSGSLGDYGWQEFKSMAEQFVNAMQGSEESGVKLAFLLFSGPDNSEDLDACTAGNPNTQPDNEKQCGISWVKRFTTDIGAVETAVGNMEWPKKTTLTSMALAEAKAELINGRQGANSVVMVVTDGKPMSPIKTGEVSAEIRKLARLIWVTVGLSDEDQFQEWASKPWQDNVLGISEFSTLDTPSTLNKIISSVCPQVQ